MKNQFQNTPGQIFYKGSYDQSAQEQEEQVILQFRKENSHGHRAESIDRTQWAADKSPVYKLMPVDSGLHSLSAPSDEGIKEKISTAVDKYYTP